MARLRTRQEWRFLRGARARVAEVGSHAEPMARGGHDAEPHEIQAAAYR